jgi:hypothetical protein
MTEFEIVYGELVPVCEDHKWDRVEHTLFYKCSICGRFSVYYAAMTVMGPVNEREILGYEEAKREGLL